MTTYEFIRKLLDEQHRLEAADRRRRETARRDLLRQQESHSGPSREVPQLCPGRIKRRG
jgi:hypothetical protein